MSRLIGVRCKRGNTLSRDILIGPALQTRNEQLLKIVYIHVRFKIQVALEIDLMFWWHIPEGHTRSLPEHGS